MSNVRNVVGTTVKYVKFGVKCVGIAGPLALIIIFGNMYGPTLKRYRYDKVAEQAEYLYLMEAGSKEISDINLLEVVNNKEI